MDGISSVTNFSERSSAFMRKSLLERREGSERGSERGSECVMKYQPSDTPSIVIFGRQVVRQCIHCRQRQLRPRYPFISSVSRTWCTESTTYEFVSSSLSQHQLPSSCQVFDDPRSFALATTNPQSLRSYEQLQQSSVKLNFFFFFLDSSHGDVPRLNASRTT